MRLFFLPPTSEILLVQFFSVYRIVTKIVMRTNQATANIFGAHT